MKRRWWIQRTGGLWCWYRSDWHNGLVAVGPVARHPWTRRVRRFAEVPDAPS